MLSLQTLPVELLCRIFSYIDYSEVEHFSRISGSCSFNINLASQMVLTDSHVFVTNFSTEDFQDILNASSYIENVARMIHSEVNGRSCQKLHITSSLEQPVYHPKILTLYLALPDNFTRNKTRFSGLIEDFIERIQNDCSSLIKDVQNVNIYIDAGDAFTSENNVWRYWQCYEQLKRFELTCISSASLKSKLHVFSLSYSEEQCHNSSCPLTYPTTIRIDFDEFSSLTHLTLTHHESIGFKRGNFRLPKALISLNLSHCKSLWFDFFKFGSFPPYLQTLDIAGNEVGEIMREVDFKQLTFPESLKCLILSNNNITSLQSFRFPSSLKSLDLSGNNIMSISNVLFPESLANLNLSNNCLESLAHCSLPCNLKRLSIGANHIRDSISSSGLPLVHFPQSLIYLDLSMNKIHSTSSFSFPDGIEELDLSYNSIEVLEEDSSTFLNLIMLNISGNPLRSLDLFVCKNESHSRCNHKVPKLRALFLNDIKLVHVFKESLQKSKENRVDFPESLRFLNMRNTGIVKRKFDISFGSNLKVLNMS
ncbi:hypothetical protein CLIB1423_13S01024 [[Candida] railenensis]|uniref:F-box domain-containing protein n=1 Tax=[Candida] railenensis TaxID=45579 RepID=A0A9P0QS24_9ASCO|nr:hypothetical protein CLIB1423_13S01024 [[Candida] railenensis]